MPRWGWNLLIVLILTVVWWGWKQHGDYSGDVLNQPPPNPRIYMFGDSMTYGSGADPGQDLPTLLAQRLGRPVTNGGVPGETTGSALMRLDEVLQRRSGTFVVLLGGNDVLQKIPSAQVESNLATIIERAQAGGSMVVLVGMTGRPFDGISKTYLALAERYRCVYVPDVLSGIFFDARYKADPIHPNSKGYAIMADRIAERMKPYLD